jgi:hypothetical protein
MTWGTAPASASAYSTFGKSGHLAPHWSFKFRACFRGQSAVISSDQSNSLALMPAFDQPMEVIPTPTATLCALNVEHVELADEVAENDGAFTRHGQLIIFLRGFWAPPPKAHCPARLGPGGASEIQDLGRGGAGWNRTTCTPHARCGVNGTNRPPLLYSATVLDEY